MPVQSAIESVGLVAGLLTTLAYVPQVVKVWRSRSARDISLGMFLLMNLGIALWLAYGLLIGSPGLILANAVTLLLTAAVLIAKLKFDRPAAASATISAAALSTVSPSQEMGPGV